MTLLHDYFKTRNLQGFQRLLDGSNERGSAPAAPSTSAGASGSNHTPGGKSWTRTGGLTNFASNHLDVNARDWLGRTALHLVCTSLEGIEYARALLKHPNIDVNLPDTESMWTPLHRALYTANLPVALMLLQRSDINASLKDVEGYTAFDLYNSTVNGTKPNAGEVNAELFTWGANRNAALGLSDANDRTYPDHVIISSKEDPAKLSKMTLAARFSPIHVRQIQMSKLHTAVITDEPEGNVRLCGFGSGGRWLGSAQHMQYSLKPLPSLNLPIQSVALGQDHTLALTKSGEVYSWGLNRFSQLGYIVELPAGITGRHEEPIQSVPKRIVGLLRREVVIGVAASRNASACWTKEVVFTWGTNTGQLGYDKSAQPVQITPRPVTKFSNYVIDVAMSDTVLVALLANNHVECVWNDRHYRISFPVHAFPTGIEPYRPPQSIKDSCISKVTCCDDTFAALSSNGEVFTFSSPNVNPDLTTGEGRGFKPQRVWALRKKFSAVKDVALGSDGSIIICTESGHVFVRTRNAKGASGKAFKFERIPYLQRVTQVCANNTGAFGALRIDYEPKPIEVSGNIIAQDLKTIQPYLQFYRGEDEGTDNDRHITGLSESDRKGRGLRRTAANIATSQHLDDEPEDDTGIECDIHDALQLYDVLVCEQQMRKAGGGSVAYETVRLPHGADTVVHVQSGGGATFPVHRVILGTRSHVLAQILAGSEPISTKDQQFNLNISISMRLLPPKPGPGLGVFKITRLSVGGCHSLSMLILLRYLYSDELLAIWDGRIGMVIEKELQGLHANPSQIKAELQALAALLDLPALMVALEPPVKREPVPSMRQDLQRLFESSQSQHRFRNSSPLSPDVVLDLADRQVFTHSAVLRARSPLFASFFELEDWTKKRWDANGKVLLDMKHLKWNAMQFVLAFMCFGADKEMFDVLEFIDSVEVLLPFMFEILAAANELLLDRLILLCSSVVLQHSNISNACYVLADATHFHVQPLIEKLQEYISVNMESFLESRILDEIPYSLVKQLAKFVMQRQIEKSPFARSDVFVQETMAKHAAWLADEDIPETIVRSAVTARAALRKDRDAASAARLSPPTPSKKTVQHKAAPSFVPPQRMLRRPPSGDEIFIMDEQQEASSATLTIYAASQDTPTLLPVPVPPVWKAHGAPRVDMKALMAEEASHNHLPTPSRHPSVQNLSQASRPSPSKIPLTSESPSSYSPYKPSGSKAGASTSWRINVNAEQGFDAHGMGPATPPKAGPNLPRDGSRPGPSAIISKGQTTPSVTPTTPGRAQAQAPGLGPVITPSRHTPSKSGLSSTRNVSGGKAWTQPPAQPSTPTPSAPTRGMSFVAIQHSQQEAVPAKDSKARSLRKIQEEERAIQAEADFLKWWAEEEERVQQEALALSQFQENLNKNESKPNKRPRHQKPKGKEKEKEKTAPTPGSASGDAAGRRQPAQQVTDSQSPASRKQQPRKARQQKTVADS
ncbi:hypothetical protein CPB84DRAFT_141917 [Gymnopilus junonius]|uniref:BTB domain-containing protein n=1 Tax=Gymnopilus junonius TaxID=109634 RepID=A0A9P5NH77_GYMJU|nr:hypothetical protein CPB84DRAFT_141917 [Gymnopilus junonius]